MQCNAAVPKSPGISTYDTGANTLHESQSTLVNDGKLFTLLQSDIFIDDDKMKAVPRLRQTKLILGRA